MMLGVSQMDFGQMRKAELDSFLEEPRAKRHQPMAMELPLPLTEPVVAKALTELSQGTARAVESCLDCYRGKRMSSADLLSFVRSISIHSTSLAAVFKAQDIEQEVMGEAAGADDMAELMALWGSAPANATPMGTKPQQQQQQTLLHARAPAMATPHAPAPPSQPATNPMPAIAIDAVRPPASRLITTRTRKAKMSEPSDEEMALMQWWSRKRLPEIARRQHESAECNALPSEGGRHKAYVRFLMRELVRKLPPAGVAKLLEYVKGFNSTLDIGAFAEQVKELVDDYDVKVMLHFPPECTVRVTPSRPVRGSVPAPAAVAAIDLDGDDLDIGDDCWPAVANEPAPAVFDGGAKAVSHSSCLHSACAHDSAAQGKRKRTETLHGARPDDDEDMGACCPVCVECPREDDRWVKCDGCGSWYHQICVLFNEIAHGKSVRFFCRTPGCRKRGSRQLNRRQRKPTYPTSPSIESCSLGDKMSAMVQPVARPDRNVVIKVVASVESQREAKGNRSGRKLLERCRNKTICAFQHTLIGSDLLFLIMFVEEIVGADGVGRVEIRHVSSNGMYEQLQRNEAVSVENAIIQSYLHHVAEAGFASARIHVGPHQRSLFFGAPPSTLPSATASVPSCVQLLADARRSGIVHSFQQERTEGNEEVLRVMMVAPGTMIRSVAPERDPDVVCPVAQTPEDWLQVQEQHAYKFDDLQFAKFSSMMLVYHLIKGWKKEFTAPSRFVSSPACDTPPQSTGPRGTSKQLQLREASPSPLSSPEMHPAQGGLPMVQPMREHQYARTGAQRYGMPAPEHMIAAEDSFHLHRFANDTSLPEDVRRLLQATVQQGRECPFPPVQTMHAPTLRRNCWSSSSLDSHLRQYSTSPTPNAQMVAPPSRYFSTSPTPNAQLMAARPRQSSVMHSIVPGGADAQDTFFSDQILFSEPAEEESPFWDCFFSSLN
jgi:hypothetical protein